VIEWRHSCPSELGFVAACVLRKQAQEVRDEGKELADDVADAIDGAGDDE